MFEYTWRWYGPNDRITLKEIRQAGASGIVSALHHIPVGEVWPVEEILKRRDQIAAQGLVWSVVESVPVHENIKRQVGNYLEMIDNYKQTLVNLGESGITTVCYNFMPVLDWSRTQLYVELEDGALALAYHIVDFVAFDMFILKRPKAELDYPKAIVEAAKEFFAKMDKKGIQELKDTILLGLPGSGDQYTLEEFQAILDTYKGIDRKQLQQHLFDFVDAIMPVADAQGILMGIHPDDPSWDTFGLPRIMSNMEDAKALINRFDSPSNGITLCTGSWGTAQDNNLVEMAKVLAHRINFVHLRNVVRDKDRNFMEAYLLDGDLDMVAVSKALIEGFGDRKVPVRPDHGHQMLGDIGQDNYPGYSLYGRMKGLAEIKGIEYGIRGALGL
ncbi:MAG: mannonate dehydratase [Bacteroidales bacterium]|jgi:mannonate dehydratase|nr:mannonate dehydratase [Bacteroidales bacterium]